MPKLLVNTCYNIMGEREMDPCYITKNLWSCSYKVLIVKMITVDIIARSWPRSSGTDGPLAWETVELDQKTLFLSRAMLFSIRVLQKIGGGNSDSKWPMDGFDPDDNDAGPECWGHYFRGEPQLPHANEIPRHQIYFWRWHPFIMAMMTMTMMMIVTTVMISEDRHELAALWLECKELSILFWRWRRWPWWCWWWWSWRWPSWCCWWWSSS